jgi:ribosomal protein S18 acetylase RimI-like enzyme
MVQIRSATTADAIDIDLMIQQFQAYLNSLDDGVEMQFSRGAFLRDGFGTHAAFSCLIAELEGNTVGYLIYHFGYDTEHWRRNLHVLDLYVDSNTRGQGAGKALMLEAVRICKEAGGNSLFWAVFDKNFAALEFYKSLGARLTKDLVFMRLEV